jgi:hypothetical protein
MNEDIRQFIRLVFFKGMLGWGCFISSGLLFVGYFRGDNIDSEFAMTVFLINILLGFIVGLWFFARRKNTQLE